MKREGRKSEVRRKGPKLEEKINYWKRKKETGKEERQKKKQIKNKRLKKVKHQRQLDKRKARAEQGIASLLQQLRVIFPLANHWP
jgi:hypothetical protein